MSQHNAFAYSYMISKLSWSMEDNHFDKVFAAPLPPIKRVAKKIKNPVTKTPDETWNREDIQMFIKK